MGTDSWILNEYRCKLCKSSIVVTQPDSENYPIDDYQMYCANPKCEFHNQTTHVGDQEIPLFVEKSDD